MNQQRGAAQSTFRNPLSGADLNHPYTTRLLEKTIYEIKQGWMPFIALLGPQGSGKSEILRDFLETLPKYPELKTRGLLLDLYHLSIREEEQMYVALLENLRQAARQANLPSEPLKQPLSLERQFPNAVLYYLSNTYDRLFLCFDHLDCVPRYFARSLLNLLREIRDQVDVHIEYKRLGVVVAGAISLFELRRDEVSAFILGSSLILPSSKMEERQMLVERYLAHLGVTVGANSFKLLAEFTGGERTFLEPLVEHLRAKLGARAFTYKSLKSALESQDILSVPVKAFWNIAVQLLGDDDLREVAITLVRGQLSPRIMNAGSELDRIQLSGLALVTSEGSTAGYCLRNRFLEGFLRMVLDLCDKPVTDSSYKSDMIGKLETLRNLRVRCCAASDLESAAAALSQMWPLLTGHQCATLYFVVRDRVGGTHGRFEYSNGRLAPVLVARGRSGPPGWIAEHVTDKSSNFVGIDKDFLYAICKTTGRQLEISITVALPSIPAEKFVYTA
jgi:hypothetical protein